MGDLSIFVLTSDSNFRDYLCNYLLMDGHYVEGTDKSDIARHMLKKMHFDLILLSLCDEKSEMDFLSEEDIHDIDPDSEVVFLFNPKNKTDYEIFSFKTPKNCLIKPFLLEDLPLVLKKVAKCKSLKENMSTQSLKKSKRFREKRKSCRIRIDLPIKYTFISPLGNIPSEENITKIVNISVDGIMFRIDCKAKFLDTVYLSILLPTCITPINIIGEIIWDTFNSFEPWRYVGVKFFNMNQENKTYLKSFILSRLG